MPCEDLLNAVLRRRQAALSVLTTGMAVSLMLALTKPPIYQATAKLMVTSQRLHLMLAPDAHAGTTVEPVSDQDLNAEIALLHSPGLLREVLEPHRTGIEAPGRDSVLENLWSPLRSLFSSEAAPSPFDQWVASTAEKLSVDAIKGSNLIQVSLRGDDPQSVAFLVNQILQHHIDRQARTHQRSVALEFIEDQRQSLAEKAREAEAQLAEFYRREGTDAASTQRATVRTRVGELEAALAAAEIELAEAATGGSETSAPVGARTGGRINVGDPLQSIRTHITELRLQRAELASRLVPTSLKLQMFDQQIAEAEQLLKTETRRTSQDRVNAAKARTDALRRQLDVNRNRLVHLDAIAPEADRLEQQLASAREALLAYARKAEEARLADALDPLRVVDLRIVEPADVPVMPQRSQRSATLLLGAAMSLAAALGLALLLDRIDPTVQTAASAQRAAACNLLAEIPS